MIDPKNAKTFYLHNTYYTLTINPSDKFQYFGTNNRLRKVKNFLYEQLIHLSALRINYFLVMELSEPNTNSISKLGPRVHFHGSLYFQTPKAVIRFLETEFYKLTRFSNFKIDRMIDKDKWQKYCKKQKLTETLGESLTILSNIHITSSNEV